ncbi:MAG: glycosyltransferase family 39 protein [Aliidongia sp.]
MILHLTVAGRYGIFGDELYFIICGRHPAFGYVDQPPLLPLIDAATQLFGNNVWLLRVPAALAATALIPLTAAFARQVGGNATSALLAAAAVALAPILIVLTSITATWTFEPLTWTLFAYFIAQGVAGRSDRTFLWAGLTAGVSMEAKYGIAIWIVALAIGLLLTPARIVFLNRRFWQGAVLGALIAAPSLVWQTAHGWPFLAVMQQHQNAGSNLTGTPFQFELVQIIAMHPVLMPLWLIGVIAPFTSARLAPVRFLSITFVASVLIVYLAGGRYYYLVAAYPTIFAVGAAACAGLGRRIVGGWLIGAAAIIVIVAPAILPILEPEALAAYFDLMPFDAYRIGTPLGVVFSWELGWPDLERRVADAYHALPADEQRHAGIFAANFGEAAAIDFYGRPDKLPPVISGHNQYYLWGPGDDEVGILLIVNGDQQAWRQFCTDIEIVDRFGVPFGHPMESDRPIFTCRGYNASLSKGWEKLRNYQ